ncbi:MAG: hypothetical protein IAE90_06900 [Ignavibacteria bacterium]|nr:hypothetical protein [Ignavibacteria bacterium]
MTQIEEYKNNLISFDLQSFLKKYAGNSAMQVKKDYPELCRVLSAQIALYPGAAEKLPEFTSAYCYLTRKSFEQSSSEAVAAYRASLHSGDTVIDMAGGLGIDDIALSRSFNNVISIDPDTELNTLAGINFSRLKLNNIQRITGFAEQFVESELSADLIYIDADRRTSPSGKRSVTLHDSSPDILKILNRLFEISPMVLLKLSPLVDITYLIKTLKWVKEIRIISLSGETKEITVLMKRGHTTAAQTVAVDISPAGYIRQFPAEELVPPRVDSNSGGSFLLEPASCIIKAGLVSMYAEFLGASQPDKKCVLFFSTNAPSDFIGRVFTIRSEMEFSKSALKKYLALNSITKANVSCRNFPVKPEELKKTFGLNDGGDDYFFFTVLKGEKRFFHCVKTGQ